MAYTVSYKGDNSPRRAINDWCNWLGLRRAKLLIPIAREGNWPMFNVLCGFAGVTGMPVIAAFEHFSGRALTDADWES